MKRSLLIIGYGLLFLTARAQESQIFEIEDLYAQAEAESRRYLQFVDNEKLSSGLYQLDRGDTDRQEPHDWDELYYVLEGRAQLVAGTDTLAVRPGAILFVAARVEHRFIEIEEDIKLIVFFSKKE